MTRRPRHKSDPIFKKLQELERTLCLENATLKSVDVIRKLLETIRLHLFKRFDISEETFRTLSRPITDRISFATLLSAPPPEQELENACRAVVAIWVTLEEHGAVAPHSLRHLLPWPDEKSSSPRTGPRQDGLALAIIELQEEHGSWKGTMAELLAILQPKGKGDPTWPTTPHKLTRCITKVEPLLESRGITVTKLGRAKKGNIFLISASTEAEVKLQETLAR